MPSQTSTQENRASGVIPSAPWRVATVGVLPGYRLAVTFRDGLSGILDCSAILKSNQPGLYAPLADEPFFGQVEIEPGALTWPNGADLDPAWMHENLRRGKSWSVPF